MSGIISAMRVVRLISPLYEMNRRRRLTMWLGLYFKLHGTHRPNSMKKTVIKRRKRVPAAGGAGGARMSDQAAAEALVAVARLGVENGGSHPGEESDGETDQPRKKRARKGRADHDKSAPRRGLDDEDIGMSGADGDTERDGGERSSRALQGKRTKDPTGSSWPDNVVDGRLLSSRGVHIGELGSSSAPSPSHEHHQAGRGLAGQDGTLDTRYATHTNIPRAFSSPHGGFELPPLNAAVGAAEMGSAAGGRGYSGYGFAGTPSSYMRSGSSAPSRTHSPLGPAVGVGPGYTILPTPHGLAHHYYPGMPPPPPSAVSALHGHSPPPPPPSHDTAGAIASAAAMLGSISVPTMTELEQHYYELLEHRRRLEEMFDRTDKLLLGVKKGMDELRGIGGAPQGPAVPAPSTNAQAPGPASALRAGTVSGTTVEKERTRENVWPLIDAAARE